jgi:tRNA threonylcarbamoyladenosine biosynthesis protein TsaE
MEEELAVRSAAEMRALGRRLASRLLPGDLVVLNGPLGAGKTTLVQGIGEGLDVRGPITSPTFVIARVHPSLRQPPRSGPALVHVDAYRIGGAAEVDDLDLDADLDSAVTVVEWGGGLVEGLAEERLEITISPGTETGAGGAPGQAEENDADIGQAGSGGPGSGGPGTGAADGGPGGTRLVRMRGVGARWAPAPSPARTR